MTQSFLKWFLKVFWENAGKDWWASSQPTRCTYNLQPDELGSFPADVCPDNTSQFGCGPKVKFTPQWYRKGKGQPTDFRWINKKATLTGADPESSERGPAVTFLFTKNYLETVNKFTRKRGRHGPLHRPLSPPMIHTWNIFNTRRDYSNSPRPCDICYINLGNPNDSVPEN